MPADTRESGLESLIVQHLVNVNGYEQGSNEDYCREYAVDETRLFRFLSETQPKEWAKAGVESEVGRAKFLNRLQGEIARRGVVDVLRKGFKHGPACFEAFFQLPSERNEAAKKRFSQNIFSVTRQLLSRLHVLRLRPLGRSELMELARRGAEQTGVTLTDEVLDIITAAAHGDARTLLNLVEYAASLPEEMREPEQLKSALPEVMMRHDKDGDSHYELASALIKSIRGSDPDAALYYLACLLEGGEDPRFICRRLILSASEDVGLADPNALPLAVSCQQAVEFVGMPEGFIPLAETVVYLALARKSNSSYAAYLTAAREVKYNGARPVPLHLRNASTQLQKEWGYGKEYKYPHNYPDGWVEQDYLPAELVGRRFYQPRDMGDEARLSQWWRKIHKIRKTEES